MRWQPVTAELVLQLLAHMDTRRLKTAPDRVFRQQLRRGQEFHQPITENVSKHSPTTGKNIGLGAHNGVSAHWLRHTAIPRGSHRRLRRRRTVRWSQTPNSDRPVCDSTPPHELLKAFNMYVGLDEADDNEYVLPLNVFRDNSGGAAARKRRSTGCTEPKTTRNRLHGRNSDSETETGMFRKLHQPETPSSEPLSDKNST